MMVGFFMVPVDATAVVVANPSIMADLRTDHDAVMWVTSSYLLAYAVPLLVSGRLGDRFGPKGLYLAGVALFTAASAWCGLANSLGMLVAARVFQGLGAALLTPQIMSLITRTCPPERRGAAQSIWGAAAAAATFVGPLVGGVLIDTLGWQAIFWANIPIGVAALALAVRLVPELPARQQQIGLVSVGLSGAAIFLIVFALQEAPDNAWAPWVWLMMITGLGLGAAFFWRQSFEPGAALVPLGIFRDRAFTFCCAGVLVTAFVTTAMVVPTMFYTQAVCGLSSLQSGLVIAPIPVIGGLLAPTVGRVVDRFPPQWVIGGGFALLTVGLVWLSTDMSPATPMWRIVGAYCAIGVGLAFLWIPLAANSARNLPAVQAGAGSGIYNAAQQLGAVLGSASLSAVMSSLISGAVPTATAGSEAVTRVAEPMREALASALAQSLLLPASVAACGVVGIAFMVRRPTASIDLRTTDSSTTGVLLPT